MTIYEGDTWEDNPYELSCQTGIITGELCKHKGMVEKEKIVLSDYKTKDEMHALMVEKGFELKSEAELNDLKLRKQTVAEEEEKKRAEQREEVSRQREKRRREREEEANEEVDTKNDEL